MALFKRVDSFDVTFADSFTRPELKVTEVRVRANGQVAKKGVGEKRIYCGHDQEALDKFFSFDKNPVFFIQKDDLEEYAKEIEQEYLNPTYNYGEGVKETYSLYKKYLIKLSSLQDERLYIHFSPKYDNQNRYYLRLPSRTESRIDNDNYDFIRDICLPRVTRLLFVKLIDIETNQIQIYLKPFFGGKITGSKETDRPEDKPLKDEKGKTARKGQEKYRNSIFERYPYCVVTRVTDPNLLIACHIKDYARCNQEEQFDKNNGLTMTPTIHTLFDLGYLTFDAQGNMVLSDFFRNMDRKCLGLMRSIRIDLKPESLKYLEWHNENTFIKTSKGVQIVKD